MNSCRKENPKYFAKHYYGSATEIAYKRKYSFSDRWRYYYATPEVELTRAAICAKVESLSIQQHAGTWVNSFLYSNRFGGLCKVHGGDLLMTNNERKLLEAELRKLSPLAQDSSARHTGKDGYSMQWQPAARNLARHLRL